MSGLDVVWFPSAVELFLGMETVVCDQPEAVRTSRTMNYLGVGDSDQNNG